MIDINSGIGHFSGDDTFIRNEGEENIPLFEVPSQKLTKKQVFYYNLKTLGPIEFLEERIAIEKNEIECIRNKIIDIGERKNFSNLLIEMYKEDNLSDSDEPDDPVEDGNVRGRDGYIYDFNTEDKYREFSREEKMEHLSMLPKFKKDIEEHMEKYGYFCPECPGNIPKSYVRKEGTYRLMERRGPQLCDDPACCLIAHAAIDEELFQDEDMYEMTHHKNSEYYQLLPIYTRNKNHELCALCVTK
jgi:hypothetical protein